MKLFVLNDKFVKLTQVISKKNGFLKVEYQAYANIPNE